MAMLDAWALVKYKADEFRETRPSLTYVAVVVSDFTRPVTTAVAKRARSVKHIRRDVRRRIMNRLMGHPSK